MQIWIWIGFILFVLAMLAIDLGLLNRKAHVIRIREALTWTGVCAILALLFNVAVYFIYEHKWLGLGMGEFPLSGRQAALQFLTGWIVEQSLSMDNVFVIALIFAYFRVPAMYQHRVLFWGILGALILRGVMIAMGALLIQTFDWIIYVFGGFLLLTAVKMLFASESVEPDKNILVRWARRLYPCSPTFDGERFFCRLDGRNAITPLFLVLLVVESTDVVFAVDSIPAIFGITKDPFLVFTSNVFAILCLRSMYFALAGMMDKFRFLKFSLVFVLGFVGVKMLLEAAYDDNLRFGVHIPIQISLGIIAAILVIGVVASLIPPKGSETAGPDSTDAAGPSKPI